MARTRNLNSLLKILQYKTREGTSRFIIIQFSFIQLNRYLLKSRFNSTGVNYKTNTKTQKKHKSSTNTQKQYGTKKATQKY